MTWVDIPGSNAIWQYDNAATGHGTYFGANGTTAAGVRTFTPPNGESAQETYVKVRKKGETTERGELSKNYYDFRITTSVYAILSGAVTFEPKLVFDFKTSAYKTGGVDSTLANSVTHARAGNATMTDSDGTIKWSPHNLMSYSEDLSNLIQTDTKGDPSLTFTQITDSTNPIGASLVTKVSPNFVTDPQAATRVIRIYQHVGATQGGEILSLSVFVKPITTTSTYPGDIERDLYLILSIDNNAGTSSWVNLNSQVTSGSNVTYTSVGDGWYKATAQLTRNSAFDPRTHCFVNVSNRTALSSFDPYPQADLDVRLTGFHVFRSDLGGMVNNPDRGDSYVPTTSSAVYAPRTGHHIYNGTAWVNEGLLHESEARTNLVAHSNSFNIWSRISAEATASTEISPSGSADAFIVKPTEVNGINWIYYSTQFNTGVITSISVFAKASGKSFLTMSNSSGNLKYASFNLTTGAVGTVASGYTANMEDFGNGWYRCSVTTPTGFNERAVFAVSDTDNGLNSAVNGDDGILLYGAQLEAGSTPSSYIPTLGATVTRAADTLIVPVANLPYSSTNMSFQMDGKMSYADTNQGRSSGHYSAGEVTWYRWTAGTTNFVYAGQHTVASRTGQMVVGQRLSGVGQNFYDITSATDLFTPDINVPFNMATRHGATFLNGAEGGTAFTEEATTGIPDVSSSDLNLAYEFMGTISKFRMWDEDLGESGIVTASSPSTEPSLKLTFDGSSTSSFTVLDWSE